MKRFFTIITLCFFFYSLFPYYDAEARRGFRGGFGRVSSFGKGFARSGWGSSSRKSVPLKRSFSSWGRSSRRSRATTVPPSPKAKPAGWTGGNMSRRVGKQGNVYKSRNAAESAYRKNLKTRWDKKPSSRPDYIPRTVASSGRNYDVIFNNGSYGYWGPGNTWIALTAANMLMSSAMLANHGYYYGTPYYAAPHGGGGGSAFFMMLLIFVFVSLVGSRARRY